MLRAICCAALLAGTLPATAQTSGPESWPIEARGTQEDKCVLVRSEDELESHLHDAGWNGKTNIPDIFFPPAGTPKAKIAALVTAADHSAQVVDVLPPAGQLGGRTSKITIRLERGDDDTNSGVFVVKLDRKYETLGICLVKYIDTDEEIATLTPPASRSGSHISTNSAGSDVVASTGVTAKIAQQHLLEQTRVDPKYPSNADQQDANGPVTVHVEIDEKGNVTDAWLADEDLASSNPALARAAIAAVKRWKYEPFKNDRGQAIRVHADVQLKFRSEGDEDDD